MNIPLIDLKSQYKHIKKDISPKIKDVINSASFIKGPYLNTFEKNFATFIGAKYCVGVASGTDALYLSLVALDIKAGDEVILPANTFIATAYAVLYSGAKPILIDVEEDTYNIDVNLIERAITKKTKAIIPVHLYGNPAEMTKIKQLAKKYNLYILEDACQAHGAKYKNKSAGNLGDLAAFSFYPGKNLGAYGDGGAITTNSFQLATKIRKLREYGSLSKYDYEIIGFNSRLDGLQAAILNVKLLNLHTWNDKRRNAAAYYSKQLEKKVKDIIVPTEKASQNSVFHLYVIRTSKRNALQKYLESHGVQSGIHYRIPLHLQKSLQSLGYKKGDFPTTEKLSNEILSIPLYPEITKKQQDYVIRQLKEFFIK